MKKKLFRALALFMTLCAAVGLFALSACGDGSVSYTVTLHCEENSTISNGLIVQLKGEDGSVAEASPKNGVATFSLASGSYTVGLKCKAGFEDLLNGYSYEVLTLTAEKPSATLEIVPDDADAERVVYSVKVEKPDGTAVAGLEVQLCGGAGDAYACHQAATDASGVASFELPAGSYDIHIDNPPAGFRFDNNAYKMTAEGGSLTVTLTAA